jgi:SAM-dependent methyltransferase
MTTGFLEYLMEDPSEIERLERKTAPEALLAQARAAGLEPGMRVADIGCGPGLTSHLLHQAVQPGGEVVGIDFSAERVAYARRRYREQGLSFVERDLFDELDDLGRFDFVWCRFVFEFHRSRAFKLAGQLDRLVAADGILCLADLDHNCLNHDGLDGQLVETIEAIVSGLAERADFDAYAGRHLYGHLFDLGYRELRVELFAHHLIYGQLDERERYNWQRKLAVAAQRSGCDFSAYVDGYEGFARHFAEAFESPRRFTYTPLILCCGRKP